MADVVAADVSDVAHVRFVLFGRTYQIDDSLYWIFSKSQGF